LKSLKKPLSQIEKQAVRKDFLSASHLIVLAIQRNADVGQSREDYASMAAGVQNASLYLYANGVGSKWTTGKVTQGHRTYEVVGANPETEEIVGFFWIGYADRDPKTPERPPLTKFLRDCP
jgi:hypothetical protein